MTAKSAVGRRRRPASAILLILLSLLVACGSPPATSEPAGPPNVLSAPTALARATGVDPAPLIVVVAGISRPLEPGSEIALAGDVRARLFVTTPTEGRGRRDLDLYLYRQSPDQPLDDATVAATARMRFMDHGIFRPEVRYAGGGHFVLPIQFEMSGEWELDLEIGTSGEQTTIQLLIDLFE